MPHTPPLTITPRLIDLVSRISEALGRWEGAVAEVSPRLRRENRIRSIHASLAIEGRIEFIHPFSDGNGRIGGLWQTLVLSRWKPRLADLPIETVVHANQVDYYAALAASDNAADAAPFAEFILGALLKSLLASDPASDPVSDPVSRLLAIFQSGESLSIQMMMDRLGLKHRKYFRRTFLNPALNAGKIAMTEPDSPHSPKQRYRPT